MLRSALIALSLVAFAAPAVHAKERTKEELKALKKEMKRWSKALGVKCKHCHNTKDFKEWTPQREVGHAMADLFTKKLKAPAGVEKLECGTCHTKSLKPDEAKLKAFAPADLKALAPDFKARSEAAKAEEAKKDLAEVAAFLEKL